MPGSESRLDQLCLLGQLTRVVWRHLLSLEPNEGCKVTRVTCQSSVTSFVPVPFSIPATSSVLQTSSDTFSLHPPALHISYSILVLTRLYACLCFPHWAALPHLPPSLTHNTPAPPGCPLSFSPLALSPTLLTPALWMPALSSTPHLLLLDSAFVKQQILFPPMCVWGLWFCMLFAGDGTSQGVCACPTVMVQ